MNTPNEPSKINFNDDAVEVEGEKPLAPSFLTGAPISDNTEVQIESAETTEAVEEPVQEAAVEASVEQPAQEEAVALESVDEIAEKQAAQKRDVLSQVASVVKAYGLTVEEVIEVLGGYKPKRKSSPAKPKYRDPETGVTWSGRGREPLWIKGKDRTPFAI